MGKYSKAVTAKKSVKNGIFLGVIGAGLIPVAIEYLQGFPAELKIGSIVTVGVVIGLLTAVSNWIKHRKD